MAIAGLRPFLEDARKNKYCLGCFNVFNLETLEGVIEAAISLKTPVVCAIYSPLFKYGDLETFSELVKNVSNRVNVPVILHLDHAQEISTVIEAIRYGFSSVMYDGPPDISFEEKKIRTKKVVEIAHSVGVMTEAELGYITKVGVDEAASKENLADPNLAREFVEYTGVDTIAPAIGNIHALIDGSAILNLDILREIKSKTNCFLSLHGGSGVKVDMIKDAINIGINKASFYTRISYRAIDRLKTMINSGNVNLAEMENEIRDGFKEMVIDYLKMFGSQNICNIEANKCSLCSSTKYCIQPETDVSYVQDNSKQYNELVKEITSAVLGRMKNR